MAHVEQVHIAISEEIKILQQQVIDNEVKIEELKAHNEKARDRVRGLLSAKEKLDDALRELSSLPAWESQEKKDTRVKVKPVINLILADLAPGSSLAVSQIMTKAAAMHQPLKEGSVRAFLTYALKDGAVERTVDGKYYLKRLAEKAA